jgi:signal transduction histidine kinase
MPMDSLTRMVRSALGRLGRPATAWALAVIGLAMFAALAVIYLSPITPPGVFQASGGAITLFWLYPFLGFIPVGLLLALRKPENPIGWLALVSLLLLGFESLTAIVGLDLLSARDGLGPYVLILSALWNAPGGGLEVGLLALLLVFPDGHLPSPRWRGLLLGVIAVGVVGLILCLINPTPGALSAGPTAAGGTAPTSLLAIPGIGGAVNALSTVANVMSYVAAVLVLASVFLRLRGADADRRHQIKWVAFASAVAVTTLIVLNIIPVGNSGEPPGWYFATAGPLLVIAGLSVPTAIGVAVLKYRLYDIDVIISRTLVYGSLAVLITAVYVGIAVGIGTLVGSGGKPNLALSILATAIVAIGFQPMRERMQTVANRLVYGKRATPYEVLSEFSERVSETYAADEVLPRMARVLQEGTGAESATVWLRGNAELRPAATYPDASQPGEPVLIRDDVLPLLPGATRAVEVRHHGEMLGALSVTRHRGEALTPVEEKLVDDLAHQAGLVLKNVGLSADLQARLDELRASRQRLVQAQDMARRRLERNLHDGAQQHLVAIKVKLGLAEMLIRRDPAKAAATLGQLKSDADEALETVRDLARGIYPPLLADKGLVMALESQARKATMPVRVEAFGVERYAQETEATVYFCVLEALQNAQKYAGASRVLVHLQADEDQLRFVVEDDGAGFDAATTRKGAGLTNMSDRVDALGGSIEVNSQPGVGTCVRGAIPAVAVHEVTVPSAPALAARMTR